MADLVPSKLDQTTTSINTVSAGGASSPTTSASPSITTDPIVVTADGVIYPVTTYTVTISEGETLANFGSQVTIIKVLTRPSSNGSPAVQFATTIYTTAPLVIPLSTTTPAISVDTSGTSTSSSSSIPTSISSPSSGTTSGETGSGTTSGGSSASSSSSITSGPIKSNGGGEGGVGGGVVAGVAIACLLGGALIAALLVFFLMRRRNARYNRDRSNRSNGFAEKRSSPTTAPLLGAGVGASAGAGAVAATAWQNHLPQSESDNEMRNAVQGMLTQVELHVDNYYRDTAVPLTSELVSELTRLKLDNHLPDTLIGLLPQTRSPTILIKHCLAQLVVSRVTIDEAGENNISESFLPADFTALAGATGSSRSGSSRPAYAPALSQHRRLTSYLRPPPSSDRAYLAARDKSISRAADTFTAAFSPWSRPTQSPDARRAHLISVLKAAADTGILIFSQPSSFRWVWDMPRSGGGGGGGLKVVVLPGFVKVADETARVLDRPQLLIEPTVSSLT